MKSHRQIVKSHFTYAYSPDITQKTRVIKTLIGLCTNAEKPSTGLFHSLLAGSTKWESDAALHTFYMVQKLEPECLQQTTALIFRPSFPQSISYQVPPLLAVLAASATAPGMPFCFHTPYCETNQQQHALPGRTQGTARDPARALQPIQNRTQWPGLQLNSLHFIHSFSWVMWK